VAADEIAELHKTGVTPVLSKRGFKQNRPSCFRSCESGGLMVVSIDSGRAGTGGMSAEVGAGYLPRFQLERLREQMRRPDYIPHYTMALFFWRVPAPEGASFAPERGQPFSEWWALGGGRTAHSAEVLAETLAEQTVPRLERLQGLDAQCAAVDGAGPDAETFDGTVWGPVLVRLGRAPRAEVEEELDRLDRVPLDGVLAESARKFSALVRGKLDSIYSQ
jgi:hypothetical protein